MQDETDSKNIFAGKCSIEAQEPHPKGAYPLCAMSAVVAGTSRFETRGDLADLDGQDEPVVVRLRFAPAMTTCNEEVLSAADVNEYNI